MRLCYFFILMTIQLVARAQLHVLPMEQVTIPVVASELENLVASQLISQQDAQQLSLFFERGGTVQQLFQLQGLLLSDLSTVVELCTHLFAPISKRKQQHFSWSTSDLRYEVQFNFPQLIISQQGLSILKDSTHLGPAFACQQRLSLSAQSWRFGAQLAKDAGEPIWQQQPSKGIDFMSAYATWLNPNQNKVLQKMTAGAYQVQWGQGLQLWSSRGLGKSIDLLQLAKNPLGIKPYQGRDEQRFLQGVAGALHIAHFELLYLASFKYNDLRPQLDTLQEEINFSYTSGLHRTPSEIAKRKQGQEQLYGIGLRRKTNLWQYGMLVLYQELKGRSFLDTILTPSPSNKLAFWSLGAYAQGTWRQFYYYAECAAVLDKEHSFYQSSACNLAFVYHLDNKLELGLHLRNYGPFYRAFYANPISNTTSGANERGCIFQLKWQLQKALVLKLSTEYLNIPHLINAQQFPRSMSEQRILIHFQPSKKRVLSAQLACRSLEHQRAQLRSSLTAELKISESESICASVQFNTILPVQSLSRHVELSWQHAPLSSVFRFEFIYGLYQVPANAPLLYSYPYLLGFGAQTMLLNGIGSYLNGAMKISFESDWQLGIMVGCKQALSPTSVQKIQGAIRLQKQF